jgi:NADPH:quinone reductase-like Zn-dependent oxidoreductase
MAISWMPDGINFSEAAALPCAGFTAYQALHRKLRVQSGKTILINGGAGGVGGFAVQLAKIAGLSIIATSSSHNFKFVKDLGANYTLDYQRDDIAAEVDRITDGKGVEYIFDTVSSESATNSLHLLAYNGAIACVAGLPDITTVQPFEKAFSLHELALLGVYGPGNEAALEDLAKIAMEFGALVTKRQIRPMLEEVVSLEEVPDALTRLSMRHVRGKIVAKIIP